MAPVVKALRAAKMPVRLVSTGQHTTLVEESLKYFDLKPDVNLRLMKADQTPLSFLTRAIAALDKLFDKGGVDVVLAQGDTTSVAAASIVCFHRKIPFGHIEAGLRTHDLLQPWPEEWNRRVASVGAAWHFAPTGTAVDNLRHEGIPVSQIYETGNTVVDALQYILKVKPAQLELAGVPSAYKDYVLLTCHRRENLGQPMVDAFTAIADYASGHPELEFWYPTHPNPVVQKTAHQIFGGLKNVRITQALDYLSFVHAMNYCRLVISDSGGVQEEAPSLGKRVIVLRNVTERPEGVEAGFCYLTGTDRARITQALDALLAAEALPRVISPYGDGRAANRIVKILQNAGVTGVCA